MTQARPMDCAIPSGAAPKVETINQTQSLLNTYPRQMGDIIRRARQVIRIPIAFILFFRAGVGWLKGAGLSRLSRADGAEINPFGTAFALPLFVGVLARTYHSLPGPRRMTPALDGSGTALRRCEIHLTRSDKPRKSLRCASPYRSRHPQGFGSGFPLLGPGGWRFEGG